MRTVKYVVFVGALVSVVVLIWVAKASGDMSLLRVIIDSLTWFISAVVHAAFAIAIMFMAIVTLKGNSPLGKNPSKGNPEKRDASELNDLAQTGKKVATKVAAINSNSVPQIIQVKNGYRRITPLAGNCSKIEVLDKSQRVVEEKTKVVELAADVVKLQYV